MTFKEFRNIVQETFALEPVDKHTESALLRMLKIRFPGDYKVLLSSDRLGNTTFTLVFNCPVEETYFKLKYA